MEKLKKCYGREIESYLINPNDEEALKRIINYPARGIGATTMEQLKENIGTADIDLSEEIIEKIN